MKISFLYTFHKLCWVFCSSQHRYGVTDLDLDDNEFLLLVDCLVYQSLNFLFFRHANFNLNRLWLLFCISENYDSQKLSSFQILMLVERSTCSHIRAKPWLFRLPINWYRTVGKKTISTIDRNDGWYCLIRTKSIGPISLPQFLILKRLCSPKKFCAHKKIPLKFRRPGWNGPSSPQNSSNSKIIKGKISLQI